MITWQQNDHVIVQKKADYKPSQDGDGRINAMKVRVCAQNRLAAVALDADFMADAAPGNGPDVVGGVAGNAGDLPVLEYDQGVRDGVIVGGGRGARRPDSPCPRDGSRPDPRPRRRPSER